MNEFQIVYEEELATKEVARAHQKASLFRVHEEIPKVESPILASVGPFAISNTTTSVMLILVIIIALFVVYVRKFSLVPKKFQNALEAFYEYVLSLVTQVLGDRERAFLVAPYIAALFFYLLVANLLPLIPPLSAIYTGDHIPVFRGTTTDFNTTFALALCVIIIMQIIGMKVQGVRGYLSHFIQIRQVVNGFKKSAKEGCLSIVGFFVGLIEILSEGAKIFSLSLRLFGNMFAHDVFMVILLGAFAFGVPALWMGMGILVGVIQALVFISLVTVYLSLVTKKH